MRIKTLAHTLTLVILTAARAGAQDHPNVARGLGATGSFGTGDLDTVNHFNGNLVIRLPLGQAYPVNGDFSYQLKLVYNSQVWEHQNDDGVTRAIPARDSNAGLGWSLQLGRLNPPKLEIGSEPPPPPSDYYRNVYHSPDGSSHAFYPNLHEGEPATAGVEYTRDGSYLRLKTGLRQIEFPDGTVHTFSSLANGYLTRMEDRFGNFVQVDYLDCPTELSCGAATPHLAHRWRLTDRHGRTHWIHLRDTGQPFQPLVVTRLDLAAFGGARAIYKLLYNNSAADDSADGAPVALTGCKGTGIPSSSNHLIWLLTRLVLPDGSVYDLPSDSAYFSFDVPGDLSNACKTGLLRRLRLPTLGSIDWDYQLYKFPRVSARSIWQESTGVGVRRLLDAAGASIGEWTYETSLTGGTPLNEKLLTNTVRDPLGNKTRRYFSVCVGNCTHPDGPYEYGLQIGRDAGTHGGRFLSEQRLDAAGAIVRSAYSLFEHDLPSSFAPVQERSRLNQRPSSQRTVFNDDPDGTVADEVAWDFDGHGHYRYRQTQGNFPGSNVKTSFRWFNSQVGTYGQPGYVPWPATSPWVLNVTGFVWDAEGDKCAARSMAVDPSTGWISRTRIHRSSTCSDSNQDILIETYGDGSGNLLSERHYGGDTQWIATGNIHSIPLPQPPQYRIDHVTQYGTRKTSTYIKPSGGPLEFQSLDLTIDWSTGLPSASRDTAGKRTTFTYDPLARLTVVDPTDDLLTVNSYCTATSLPACPSGVRAQQITARASTPGGTAVVGTRQRFDDWGRLTSAAERMPPSGNYVARTFIYNALGWRTFVSERGSVAMGTTYRDFDAFGRPRTIRPADGSSHDVTMSYKGLREVTRIVNVATAPARETNAVTMELYDRHGRLYEVTEPNGTKTRYEYDPGNRLTKVCQGATGAGTTTCGQQRLFAYDMGGALISEQHPEKGAFGNGVVSYLGYDARGHLQRRIDGPNDLTFVYDAAERLLLIRETGGARRVLKSFSYASANGTAAGGLIDWRQGKLASASRFNYVGPPFNATAEIRDTYVYQAAEGRIGEHSRQLVFNGVDKEKFTTTYAYDGLGLVSTLGYPDCVAGDCAALDTPRTVSFSYSYGRLVSVPGYTGTAGGVSEITYHPSGLVHQVPHINGVLFTQQNDPNGLPRPGSISATNGPTTLWTTGAYAYDGAGNVKAMGTQTFLYDSLSRVVDGHLDSGRYQLYSYDAYGNITGTNTDGGLLSIPTSSATNRLTGAAAYDAAGNLTSWNSNSYEYDPFNNLHRYRSGAEDWVYIYGADDERFWSWKVGGGGSLWALRDLAGRVLRDYDAHLGWNQHEDYIYRGAHLLSGFLSSGQRRHFDVDHLGSVRLVTNLSGGSVSVHGYYPFGKENTALQEGEQMKFTGHERDLANPAGDGDDLDYMHARHYNPLTGRFLSTDRGRGTAGEPQSFDLYAYVQNDPMTFVDRNGRERLPSWAEDLWGYGSGIAIAVALSLDPATKAAGVAAGVGYPVYRVNVALNAMNFDLGPIHVRPESGRGLRILAPGLAYAWAAGEWAVFRWLYGPDVGLVRTEIAVRDAEGNLLGPPFIRFYQPDTFAGLSPEQLQKLELRGMLQSGPGGQVAVVYWTYTPPAH